MAATLKQIREALAESLGGFDGQVSPYMLSNPTPPVAHVFPDRTDYHQAMQNGTVRWRLLVEVLVGLTSDIGAQQTLDKYLALDGPDSLKAMLEADEHLGGLVADVTVTEATGYRQYQIGGVQGLALGASWTVDVLVG